MDISGEFSALDLGANSDSLRSPVSQDVVLLGLADGIPLVAKLPVVALFTFLPGLVELNELFIEFGFTLGSDEESGGGGED